ncbi:type II toxin-antitoxin system HicA family toxin [Candidatus Peregrinibacteria bacterium]|nr:type II toxin-antitoxin system HicA family toxin [Candidatus Peregrinibacteria bacterium]
MPRPIALRTVIRILVNQGFELVSQHGSHAKYRNDRKTVIVKTTCKEIPHGTFQSILLQSGLSEADFRKK